MNLREQIIASTDTALSLKEIEVPEWGVTVYVRGMTGLERDALEASLADAPNRLHNARGRIAAICCCDRDGNRIFEPADAEILGRKSAIALDRIFRAAATASGLTADQYEATKKNSDGEAGAGSA